MKQFYRIWLILIIAFFVMDAGAQVKVDGFLQSNLYSWENRNENKQWDYYQELRLRVSPENNSGMYFNTYLREGYFGDPADWDEKVHNLYLNWDITDNYRVRLGRQFIYNGVINGTLDALMVGGRIMHNLKFRAVAGTETPYSRDFKMTKWDNGNVLGGYLGYDYLRRNSIEVSYVQKTRSEEQYWQQVGGTLHGFLCDKLNYYARFDYNLLDEKYQTLRLRLMYYAPKWSLTAEYNSQRPRIYEDSFFNIFNVKAHNQIRTAASYRLGSFDLGLQYLFTVYEVHEIYILHKDQNDSRVIGSVGNRYGTIGLIYQNGYAGNNIGYFGELRYELLKNLTARLYHSYYNYELATSNISEDALSFSAGLSYRLMHKFILRGEVQQANNSYYKNDWRGLFRATYLFQL